MRSWNKTHGASDRDVGNHDRDRPGGGSKQKASGGDERRLAQKSQATTLLRYCFEDIATCGGDIPFDPSEPNPQKTYTLNFGSTSGATAIVARAAVLLQSWVVKELGSVFDTVTRRALWSALDLNTRSKRPKPNYFASDPEENPEPMGRHHLYPNWRRHLWGRRVALDTRWWPHARRTTGRQGTLTQSLGRQARRPRWACDPRACGIGQ
jgi:hypothetical protein